MPYPNEHSARVRDPGDFKEDSFRRVTENLPAGVSIMVGRLEGETDTTAQAYRFKKDKFTVAEAEAWLKEHKVKYASFEAASAEKGEAELLAGPFASKDAKRRIVTAPVLVPGEEDSDGEVVTKEKIEDVAIKFMENYGIIDVGHSLNQIAVPVESWITRTALKLRMPSGEEVEIPEGTWMLSAKVSDDKVWKGIEDGVYKGFSVTGIRRSEALTAAKSENPEEAFLAVLKRKTLLKDLGDDWLAMTVAIVEDPAVFKAKWIAIKGREDDRSFWERITALLDRPGHGRTGKQQTEEEEVDEMTKEEIQALVAEAVKSALEDNEAIKGVTDRLKALEDSGKKEQDTDADDADTKDKDKDNGDDNNANGDDKDTDNADKGTDDGTEVLKTQVDDLTKVVSTLVDKFAPKSKALDGQDEDGGDNDKAIKTAGDIMDSMGRDAFGLPVENTEGK